MKRRQIRLGIMILSLLFSIGCGKDEPNHPQAKPNNPPRHENAQPDGQISVVFEKGTLEKTKYQLTFKEKMIFQGKKGDRGRLVSFLFQDGEIKETRDKELEETDKPYCLVSISYGDDDFKEMIDSGKYPDLYLDATTVGLSQTSIAGEIDEDKKDELSELYVYSVDFKINKFSDGIALGRVDGKKTTSKMTQISCHDIHNLTEQDFDAIFGEEKVEIKGCEGN